MHITLVLPNLKGGGAERVVLNLAQGLIDRGHRLDIVLIRPLFHYVKEIPVNARLFAVDGIPARFSKEDGAPPFVRLSHLPASSRGFNWLHVARAFGRDLFHCRPDLKLLHRARAIASYMARERPDCVLPSLPRAKVATLLAGCFLPEQPPIIPIVHSNYERRRTRDRYRLRRLVGCAAHFVGVSQGTSERLAAVVGAPNGGITTIYNPVVTRTLQNGMTERPLHPWLLDGGAPVVLAVGRLERPKDFPTLLKAFARLALRRPCRLIILGEGKERKKLQGLVQKLKLDDRVSLPGWVDNPFAYMSRAALFVLSSIHEGFSMVLVEALACGCPCVSTDCPAGPVEILQDGKFGPLVAVGDEVGLAETMDRVLDRPPDKRMLQRRAADFSVDTAASAYEGLIQTIVSSGECRPRPSARKGAGRAADSR